ncbi:MAG: peptidase T [Clostridia bacterium]|nr:peptidase T [Clostridia bacterium]
MTALERFLTYVKFDTRSEEDSTTFPSTAKQLVLGRYLADELTRIGLVNVCLDENGYVYGFLPATPDKAGEPAIGFVAHMDTSPDVSGESVHPTIIDYAGGDIVLPYATLTVENFPFLPRFAGQQLVVTDGSTLLGADDKAGVAEIFTACEYFVTHPEVSHRAVAVCITPDEEIGSGADRFPYDRFAAKEAYTVDGGELGEIEYENFNGASAAVTVTGVNIHPGSAKDKMKNAALLAAELVSMLPPAETPAHTEGYEGFYHVTDISGNESSATVRMIIRDHDRTRFEQRKTFLERLVAYLNGRYGVDTFALDLQDSYYNMKEKIEPFMYLIENAEAAMEAEGVTPQVVPIRGGTDGARLSYEGLPCPNLSTGGVNFHSVHEFIPVDALETMTRILVRLAQ